MPNLDINSAIRTNFKDIVVDAFNIEESIDMSIKLHLVIEFNNDLDSMKFEDNWLCNLRDLVEEMIKEFRSFWFGKI